MSIRYKVSKLKILEVFIFVLIVGFSLYSGVKEVAANWSVVTGSPIGSYVAVSSDGEIVHVLDTGGGSVRTSTDGGETWGASTGSFAIPMNSISASENGSIVAVSGQSGNFAISTDYGASFTTGSFSNDVNVEVDVSGPGTEIIIVGNGGEYGQTIIYSSDTGASFTQLLTGVSVSWNDVAIADNNTSVVVGNSNDIFISFDGSGHESRRPYSEANSYSNVTMSANGLKIAVVGNTNTVSVSTDQGTSWTTHSHAFGATISDIQFSRDGSKLYAATSVGYIFVSTNDGATWTTQTSSGLREWVDIDVSGNGDIAFAFPLNSNLYKFEPDLTAPIITSVSSDKANGYYKVGEVIDIDVTFSENVTSTGNVTVTLETGDTDRTCTFTVSNSSFGTCNYTVQAGDTSADLTVTSISGTIADQSSNAMSNFVPTTNLAANKNLVIDTTVPTVSITAPTDGATVSGSSVSITATASDTNLVGVQFKRDTNTNIGAEDTTSTFGVTWDTTALSDGSQNLIAVARDLAGNYATSTSVSVTVDNIEDVVDTGEGEEESSRSSSRGSISLAFRNSSNQNQSQSIFRKVDDLLVRLKDTITKDSNDKKSITDIVDKLKSEFDRIFNLLDSISTTPKFNVDLELGDSHPEVKTLQQFLNSKGYLVAETGPGSMGMETEMFGFATKVALIRFQIDNGIVPAVGYFGPITRGVANGL